MLDDIMYLLFDNQFQEVKPLSYCQRSIELLLIRNPDIYYLLYHIAIARFGQGYCSLLKIKTH